MPESFSQLKKLTRLDLAWNNFREFPRQILDLVNLEWLSYFYNEKCEVPQLKKVNTLLIERPFTGRAYLGQNIMFSHSE